MSSSSSPVGSGGANIVLVQCDSMDGRVMGCMGHPAMGRATPNLDGLARRGALFAAAYASNPICCPSRASMWSGLYTHHCEGWNNYKGLEPDAPTFRTRLDAAGYATETFGKTDYLSGHHTIRARVTPWARSANIMRPCYRQPAPRVLDDNPRRVHKGDWENVDAAIEWLRRAADADRPFMLYLGLGAPHPSFVISRRYLDLVDEAGVTVPPDDETDHPVMTLMRAAKNWEHGLDPETVRLVRRIYFAMVAEVDAMMGRLMAAFDELGLAETTYLIFTSDHGELAMEHRQYYKMNLYEPSARVPLIVAGPGVTAAARIDTPISLVDIYPTLMDMARADPPVGLDGHSLMPQMRGQATDHPDWAFSEFHGTTCRTGSFMLRRGDWKYIAYVGLDPQLFDLADDPDEVRDLAAARPDVVGEMDRKLREIVDYEAVDARVKAYDVASFRQWRDQQRAAGTYEQNMAIIYSGWNGVTAEDAQPWTAEDEAMIDRWLKGDAE